MIWILNIDKILWVILKNLKIVSKSRSSMGVLVIGPLALMLLVGFSFSGATLHDVLIGVYNENVDEKLIIGEIDYGTIIRYSSLDACKDAIIEDNLDACLHMSRDFVSEGAGKIDIVIYYDNSKKISTYIVNELKGRISESSKRITQGAVNVATDNINTAYDYILSSKNKVAEFTSRIDDVIDDVRKIKNQIDSSTASIDSEYSRLENVYEDMDNLFARSDDILDDIGTVENQLLAIENSIDGPIATILFISQTLPENDTRKEDALKIHSDLQDTKNIMSNTRSNIIAIKSNTGAFDDDIRSARNNIYEIYTSIGRARQSLNSIKGSLDEIIRSLDAVSEEMHNLESDLDTLLEKAEGNDLEGIKTLADPVTTRFSPILENFSNIFFLFPTITIMIIVFVSILLANIVTLNEMHSPAYLRNFTMPIRGYIFDIGIFITSMIIAIFQIAVLFTFAEYNLNISIFSNIAGVSVLITLLVSIFTIIGMLTAYIVRNQQASILVATFVGIGTFIFSNSLIPLKVMPKISADIASYNPIVIANELLRRNIFLDVGITTETSLLLTMIGFVVVGIILLPFAKRMDKMRIS